MSQRLDILGFPLRGSQLVEASAGTGKTFTIGALYLRLVLGHGGEAAGFARPLDPPEILVVTFTDAATKELRDRIRARLAQAALAFAGEGAAPDPVLQALRDSFAPQAWPDCARRLRLAAEWMDEAAVSTIHGWCQRMLREHAFDSGSLFTQALQTDTDGLRLEATRDWWRNHVYPLQPAQALALQTSWATPDDLAGTLKSLLPLASALGPGTAPQQALAAAAQERALQLQALKQPWALWSDELAVVLADAVKAKRLKGTSLGKRESWLQALRDWAAGDAEQPALTDTAWKRLTPTGLDEVLLPGASPVRHPALDALAELSQRIAQLPDGRDQVLAHAARWVAERMADTKARRAEIGFDDMLGQLARALRGPGGTRLAERIRRQFPVALIDEFQDTDTLQWGIFDAVWQAAADRQDLALVLIGDPKQAIYSFRGADIHSYLAAKAATAPRHHTLGTNHRSSRAMVQAVNAVFGAAEQRPGGAFLFARGEARPVPFEPVDAKGRAETFEVDGGAPAALTFWWAGDGASKSAATPRMAQACAAEVVRLLRLGREGRAGFRQPDGALAPVCPADIAVLVNTGREAAALRNALRQVGVRSVYLSDDESVYHQPAADCVRRLLAAVAAPDDERAVRAALATPLLGLGWDRLAQLESDELAWEEMAARFAGWRERWRRDGVLPMLRRLLNAFDVPQRLLAAADERRLTDVLHLAELLQQASGALDGEHALLRYLAEQCAQGGSAGQEARVVRLESDAELLKVVTVHKSKGLEYPLVFLPFAFAYRPCKPDDVPLKWHDDQGQLQVALRPDAAQVALADQERLTEDLRKLYVALTRARFATWVGLAPVKALHRSAAGQLLAGGEPLDDDAWRAALQDLAAAHACIALQEAPESTGQTWDDAANAPVWAAEPTLPAPRRRWSIASYSGLALADRVAPGLEGRTAEPPPAAPASAAESTWAEEQDEGGPGQGAGLHGLPRGAATGTLLHELLEWAGRQGYASLVDQPALVQAEVARRCRARRWEAHAPALGEWLHSWLSRPWPLSRMDAALADVAPAALGTVQVELEFWVAAEQIDLAALDVLVQRHIQPGRARRPLLPGQVHGLFKGYVDLAFGHGGRWWVADWKSNALGDDDAAYTPQALADAVLGHRYDLQIALYLFALHRHLRARLPGYDWSRDVGGAAYLFLRGQGGPAGGLYLERPSQALVDGLDRLFDGAPAAQQEVDA